MLTRLSHISLPVDDYDSALDWYTRVLGLELCADIDFPGYRFLTVIVPGQRSPEIILTVPHAGMPEIKRPEGWTFNTSDCHQDIARLEELGVKIIKPPEELSYGIKASIADPFGNVLYLVQTW